MTTPDPETPAVAPVRPKYPAPGAGYATTAQRDYIDRLLRQAEYDQRTVSVPHRALARRAGLPAPEPGTSVDAWVSWLRQRDASRLIDALKRENEDIDDD